MVILASGLVIMLLGGHNALPFLIPVVFAHCDTMDGPLITEAKQTLEKGDVTPVLKWVKRENEAEVKQVFNQALAERRESIRTTALKPAENLLRHTLNLYIM